MIALLLLLTALPARASEADFKLPVKLLCDIQYKNGGVGKAVLYLRLNKITRWSDISEDKGKPTTVISGGESFDWFPDETQTGEHLGIHVTRESVFYSQWACDTEARDYHFDTHELALPADSKDEKKKVGGVVRVEVREDREEHLLQCDAIY